MMDEKLITRFCVGCGKKHKEVSWRWHSRTEGDKKHIRTIWWCGKCVDCAGCKKIHYNDTGRTLIRGYGTERIELCGLWYKSSPPSIEKRMQNMSPDEVLSGVQYGNEKVFNSGADDWSKEKAKGIDALREVL